MNPPDQPTQPTEAHKELAEEIRHIHRKGFPQLVPRLLADSEARAVEAATVQLRSELNYAKASETLYHDEGTAAIAALTTERERVRLLESVMAEMSEAITAMTGNSDEPSPFMSQAGLRAFRANKKAKALAATKEKT
jgi:hypothetical protein